MEHPFCCSTRCDEERGAVRIWVAVLLLLAIVFGSVGCKTLAKRSGPSAAVAHSVTVSWKPSASPNVTGYIVYRRLAAGGDVVILNSTPISAISFEDHLVEAGKTYVYYVTAVDAKNRQSRPSEPVQVTVPD